MKIKKTVVSEIDENKLRELYELEKSGDMTREEVIKRIQASYKYEIDVAGTIKDNVKKAWDVVTDKDNFGKVLSIGTISALLFICGDYHRTNVKIRKKYNV